MRDFLACYLCGRKMKFIKITMCAAVMSLAVTASATAAAPAPNHGIKGLKAACAALSHDHVAGQKGTPFSRCVVAVAKAEKTAAVAKKAKAACATASKVHVTGEKGTAFSRCVVAAAKAQKVAHAAYLAAVKAARV